MNNQEQEFTIHIPITRAYRSESGEMMFEGTASSTSVDSHETIFNEECQDGFKTDILEGMERGEPVELESEHNGELEPMNILGPVISADVVDNTQLKIIGRLDPDNPKSVYYFNKMTVPDPITKRTKQFGLSINGNVLKAHYEYNNQLNKTIRVFDRVILKRVGIVRKPSNPDSWIEKLIRSVQWENVETVKSDSDENSNNQNLTERSNDKMSENTDNKEIETEQVAAEAQTEEVTEVRNDETSVDSPAVDETPADVEPATEEAPAEAAPVADVEVVVEVEAASEVERAEDEKVETLDRASWWKSDVLLESMEAVVEAICYLEGLKEYDNEDINTGATEEALTMAKQCILKITQVFGEHVTGTTQESRQIDASNSVESQKESLDDKITVMKSETEPVVEAEEVARTEDTPAPNLDSILDVVASYLKDDFTNQITVKFQEMLDRSFDEKFGEKIAEVNSGVEKATEELKRELSTVKEDNAKLVERLVKVESEPATRPGAQLIEEINRSNALVEKRTANIQRARDEGDTLELMKHKAYPNTYIGYGEFTFNQ